MHAVYDASRESAGLFLQGGDVYSVSLHPLRLPVGILGQDALLVGAL